MVSIFRFEEQGLLSDLQEEVSYETSVHFYRYVRRYISDDNTLQAYIRFSYYDL
jgi:hypothetical protein